MKKGTKSLLFGVHTWWWHPITVYLAWWRIKGHFPGWRELVCAIVHDWGYWGCENMDDEIGESHPEFGAKIAGKLFGEKYYNLCLYHSRHYAKKFNAEPSELCWADKFSINYERWWFYLPRAWLSGELFEYRKLSADGGFIPLSESHKTWFLWIQNRYMKAAMKHDGSIKIDARDKI